MPLTSPDRFHKFRTRSFEEREYEFYHTSTGAHKTVPAYSRLSRHSAAPAALPGIEPHDLPPSVGENRNRTGENSETRLLHVCTEAYPCPKAGRVAGVFIWWTPRESNPAGRVDDSRFTVCPRSIRVYASLWHWRNFAAASFGTPYCRDAGSMGLSPA